MSGKPLGLYDLLAPEFLLGFNFPDYVDSYLKFAAVEELHTSYDESGIVYRGKISFGGSGGASPVREHKDPNGRVFQWEDVYLEFRLTLPREGATFLQTAANALPSPDLKDLFNEFGTVARPGDYPGIRFRLELLVSLLTFHMGDSWVPGKVGDDFRIVQDKDAGKDVKFVLPKLVFVYEQGNDFSKSPSFNLKSWGNSGFDAPSDINEGELIRMSPPIALHTSGRVAFGVDQILLDLSEDSTPPEILSHFGTDEGFEGLYIKSVRIYYSDKDKGWAFNISVNDCLISFAGEVSLEAELDIIGPQSKFQVNTQIYQGSTKITFNPGVPADEKNPDPNQLVDGDATVLNTAIVQVQVIGGVPPYTIHVKLDGTDLWSDTDRQAPISPNAPGTLHAAGTGTLVITVDDAQSGQDQKHFSQTIKLTIRDSANGPGTNGTDGDKPAPQGDRQPAAMNVTSGPADRLQFTASTAGVRESISIVGVDQANPPTVTLVHGGVSSNPSLNGQSQVGFDVGDDDQVDITVAFPGPKPAETFDLFFEYQKPEDPQKTWVNDATQNPVLASYVANSPSPSDGRFFSSQPESPAAGVSSSGAQALLDWINTRVANPKKVNIVASASYEGNNDPAMATYNQRLSERRRDVAVAIIGSAATIASNQAVGQQPAQTAGRQRDDSDRAVKITDATPPAAGAPVTVTATVKRPPRPAPKPPDPTKPSTGTAPAPENNKPPDVFHRISFRFRLERNVPVLFEISGELDFETKTEKALRNAAPGHDNDKLGLKQRDGATANPNPQDGVTDFKLTITYDTSTHILTETLFIGAAPADNDGLLQSTFTRNDPPTAADRFHDIAGAVLVFLPVINSAAASLNPNSAGDWVELGLALAVPVAIGGLGVFQTQSLTLYGGEAKFREVLPSGGDPGKFSDFGVIFDYGVGFGIDLSIGSLKIKTSKPLKVRYKAVGFNLHFDPTKYQAIFDTSKGYELDLSDPGLFNLPSPLGDLLKILSARIARFNPLTLELDLGLKVDLGVVTVDSFKIKWPLDPIDVPMILPTGVRVDISSVVVGSGHVNLLPNGFEGSLDVSIVPVKVRVAASLGVQNITQGSRTATAVFAGLIVEFPSPILLGASGVGIYGFSGLFAMHYKRLEPAAVPGDPVGPALHWLVTAEGEPAKLTNSKGAKLWGPELDRWSFGIGVVLGSDDGGFLVNFRGMFVLELPGPRILIFVKVQIVAMLPSLGDADLTVGILGVIDLDFNLHQITVGILVDLEIKDIIRLTVPIEIFFSLVDSHKWHFYLGTIQTKVSALVLNIVKAGGYFMVAGDKIDNFPGENGPITLPGIAVATGIEASIVFGDEDIGLYLKISAGADLGISFSPHLFIVGNVHFDGELHIFIIGIEAHGRGDIVYDSAGPTTKVHIHVCGEIDLFFFSISACVDFTIGPEPPPPPAPDLIRNVYMQSHAPVIVAGQGGDRPIDASLGDSIAVVNPMAATPNLFGSVLSSTSTSTGPNVVTDTTQNFLKNTDGQAIPPNSLAGKYLKTINGSIFPITGNDATNIQVAAAGASPVNGPYNIFQGVPIDTVPVIQMFTSPLNGAVNTFTAPLVAAPGLTNDGWTDVGQRQVRYTLKSIQISPPPPPAPIPIPATWRRDQAPGPSGVDKQIDLALFSRVPVTASRALERSTDLNSQVTIRWGDLCKPVAPPACVLWTFCGQRLGPSNKGWRLWGIPQPDPPGTVRDTPPPTLLIVEEPKLSPAQALVNVMAEQNGAPHLAPAKVIGLPFPKGAVTGPLTHLAATASTAIGSVPTATLSPVRPLVSAVATQPVRTAASLVPTAVLPRVAATATATGTATTGIAATATATGNTGTTATGIVASVAPNPAVWTCERGLQLPHFGVAGKPGGKNPDIEKRLPELGRLSGPLTSWITFNTGQARRVIFFIAISERLIQTAKLRQLDEKGNLLREDLILAVPHTSVSGVTTGLPAPWLDPAGPWFKEVISVAEFFTTSQFRGMMRMLLDFTPLPSCSKIQLSEEVKGTILPPAMVVGVIEVCSKAEADRALQGQQVKDGEIKTVTGYLDDSGVVPLLAPGTTYTLTVTYTPESRQKPDGNSSPPVTTEADRTQQFIFRTDDHEPARLDPWVLGTTPGNGEKYHFYNDPLEVIFNDLSAIQLYKAYGKKLRARLRSADGVAIPDDEVKSLNQLPEVLGPPYRDFLRKLIEAGVLPCVGAVTGAFHGSYTMPISLRPAMAYTFDIELDPPNNVPPGAPVYPLYRRQFVTSRFPDLASLVLELGSHRVKHRALTAQIAGLPSATDPNDPFTGAGFGNVVRATDLEIQSALVAAGEQALPAPSITGITIYWAKRGGASTFSPHALLIDASEPLWRTRDEPRLETVLNLADPAHPPIDPAYQRVVPQQVASIGMQEQAGPFIDRFVVSTSGTRTLAMISNAFNPPAGGSLNIHINVHRVKSVLFGITEVNMTLLDIPFNAGAPWEE